MIPDIPRADLPQLTTATKASSLTRTLASASPKGLSTLSLVPPSSPSRSPTKSPVKRSVAVREFAVPFPITPTSKTASTSKNSVTFPQTPSRHNRPDPASSLLTPRTPTTSISSPSPSEPSTPAGQRGANASTVPQTPTSSRRQALYDRVRQRSLTSTPTKAVASRSIVGGKLTKDQMMKMGQEEMRRRCLLGRLGGVAESVWMFELPSYFLMNTYN